MRHQSRVSSVALAVLATSAIASGDTEEAATRTPDSTRAPSTKSAVPVEVPLPLPPSDPSAVTLASALAPYERFVGTDAAPGEFPRTIRHATGEARIGRAPVGVVTLDTGNDQTWIGGIDYHAAFAVLEQIEGLFRETR